MKDNSSPLVSILVVSYNSGSTILETLDSAYNQSYRNIELVISDDCSSDDTVKICKDWIGTHNDRFATCQIVTSKRNTGISANCNRGISNCKGDWVKLIAADDILMNDCIEKNVNYVNAHDKTSILFSAIEQFHIDRDGNYIVEAIILDEETVNRQNQMSSREQYLAILKGVGFDSPSPSVFVKKSLMDIHPFVEKYKGLEDVPQWTRLTKSGIHFCFMKDVTVKYRRGNTVSNLEKVFFPPIYWESKRLFFWTELKDYLIEEGMYDEYNSHRRLLLLSDLSDGLTKNNKIGILNKIVFKILSAFVFHIIRFPDLTK